MTKFKSIISLFLSVIIAFSCISVSFADEADVKVFIDNIPISLKNPCVLAEDTVYLPMEELFAKVGIKMAWSKTEKCWMGNGNNGEIRIVKDKMTADIDWVDIELPAPIKEINGLIYVPMYLIEDAWRVDPAVYKADENAVYLTSPELNFKPAFEEIDLASVVATLPKGHDLWKEEWLESITIDNNSKWAKVETVDVEGMHFDKACKIETVLDENGKYYTGALYGVQGHKVIGGTGDFTAGDVGIYTFWARATKTTDETGKAFMRACLEQTETWQKACEDTVLIDSEWRQYFVPMYQPNFTLYDGKMHLCFSVGAKPQIIEIADIHLYNYYDNVRYEDLRKANTINYKGIEEDALWRKEAYRRIDKYRSDDMVIYVKDENGNPVEGAEITADMTKNEFQIGIAIMGEEWVYGDEREEQSHVNDLRNSVYDECFNTIVDSMDLKQPDDDFRNAVRMSKNIMEKGKMQRGHCIAYLTMPLYKMRDWPVGKAAEGLLSVDYDKAYDYMMDFCTAKIWLFKDVLKNWDVNNEFYFTPVIKENWGTQMWSDVYKIQKALDPNARTYMCETGFEGAQDRVSFASGIHSSFLNNILYPMVDEERAPIDGVAVQGHCAQYLYPQGLYHQLDALAERFNSISITEYDFANADQTHAFEHMRDSFLAVYSHPKGDAFITWGFYDPWHWRNKAPFFDNRWNDKSGAYEKWKAFYNDELNPTHTAVTDKDGKAVIRSVRGDFDITINANGVTGTTKFCLTDTADEYAERDNKIEAVITGNEMIVTHTNPIEFYGKPIEFRTGSEALADYRAKIGDRKLIGIFGHKDHTGSQIRNIKDGLKNTYWYGEGEGAYAQFELVEKARIGDVSFDFRCVNGEVYNIRVLKSDDGENWTEIYSGLSSDMGKVPFDDAMFIKVESVGNKYIGISEVTINAEK